MSVTPASVLLLFPAHSRLLSIVPFSMCHTSRKSPRPLPPAPPPPPGTARLPAVPAEPSTAQHHKAPPEPLTSWPKRSLPSQCTSESTGDTGIMAQPSSQGWGEEPVGHNR